MLSRIDDWGGALEGLGALSKVHWMPGGSRLCDENIAITSHPTITEPAM